MVLDETTSEKILSGINSFTPKFLQRIPRNLLVSTLEEQIKIALKKRNISFLAGAYPSSHMGKRYMNGQFITGHYVFHTLLRDTLAGL